MMNYEKNKPESIGGIQEMKKKKMLALLLSLAMTSSLAACGGGSKSEETSKSEGSGDKPESITIMVDGTVFTKENGQEQFISKLKELTGIDIKVIQPDHSAYYDVVGQTLASGDWPDVMILGSTYYTGYASEGVLWDMSEAYENSELKGRIENQEQIDSLRVDGSLYGISPARGNGCVTYVKKAWLDNLGLDVPTTYEEYLEMCRAFTTGDPDGNGVDGDTYAVSAAGLVGTEAPYTNYLPEFYQDANPSFYKDADGVWHDGFAEQSMVDALGRLRDAYAEGLIDKETLTNGTSDCRNKFYEDKFGVFTYWAGTWATNLKTNLEANGHDGELVAIPPIEELGSYIERVAPCWCITEACENPEGVFKYFIEPMLDGGDVEFLWTYGVEGVHWSTKAEEVCGNTYEEGEFHMLESMEKEGTQYTKAHIDPSLALVPLTSSTIPDPQEKAMGEEAKSSAEIFNNNSHIADLLVSTDEMSQYNGDLMTLKSEIIAKVIIGELTVEDGMKKFEEDRGAEWSKAIVDSLNK